MTMSDRIAVMNKGRYEQLDQPEELYERPRTRFVASFLGASNLLHGSVSGTADGYTVVQLTGGAQVRVPTSQAAGRTSLDVGVRPEKIRIQDVGVDLRPTDNRLHGVISDTLYTGVSTQVRVELPDGSTLTIYEQNLSRASRSDAWRPGDQVDLGWAPEDTFAVDPSSSGAGSSTEAATGQPS